jgi:hypothetical protein
MEVTTMPRRNNREKIRRMNNKKIARIKAELFYMRKHAQNQEFFGRRAIV